MNKLIYSKPLKILLLTDSFNHCCGRSRHVHLLAKSLQHEGNTVFVAYGSGDGAPMLENDNIHFIKKEYLLHLNRSIINYLHAVIFIITLQIRWRFDVVHAHHRYVAAAAMVTSWLFRIPLVMSIHGTVKNTGILPAYIGNHFVAVSESVRSFAISEESNIRHNISTISNGIDLTLRNNDTSVLRKKLFIPDGCIIISMIGRIVDHKAHRILIDALSQLKKDISYLFIVVGEGEAENEIRKYAEIKRINIIFTGVVEDPYEYYTLSDIIVIPSLNFEGLPITLLEAGRHAKPVIVSDIAGMHDIIKNGHNGIVTKPGDIRAVALALEMLVNDESLRHNLGIALNELVTKEFSVENMTKKYISLYWHLVMNDNHAT